MADQTSERLIKWSVKRAAQGAMNQNRTRRQKIEERKEMKKESILQTLGCGKSGWLWWGNPKRAQRGKYGKAKSFLGRDFPFLVILTFANKTIKPENPMEKKSRRKG